MHENRDKLDYSMDHLINEHTRQSATYFLIELFDAFNLILDSIEFIDYVNIAQRWHELFTKVVKFADLLEVRPVILLKRKAESHINYVSVWGWVCGRHHNPFLFQLIPTIRMVSFYSTATRLWIITDHIQTETH